MKEEVYKKQVSLLLDVLPIVGKAKVFALKGGTAINFFFRDCPRLSIDIDLHYLHISDREEALADILLNMETIKKGIEKAMPDVKVRIDTDTYHAQVQRNDAIIKIEPNINIRGTLLTPVEMPLCSSLVKEFNREMKITCVAKAELYAGKLCAALDRQHPRDFFDMLLLLDEDGITRDILDIFIIYLISQGGQIHEKLNPNIKNIEQIYENHFRGMEKFNISLEELCKVQSVLPKIILDTLNKQDRKFLLEFKNLKPDWSLLHYKDAKKLPAVEWKLINLKKMDKNKRQQAIDTT